MSDPFLFDFCILGFGGFFCFVWAFGLLLGIPTQSKWTAFAFVFLSGLRLVWESITLSGYILHFPIVYALPVPFLYLIGPSIFIYYENLRNSEKKIFSFLHLGPFLLSLFPIFYWIKLDSEMILQVIQEIPRGNWHFPFGFFILWTLGPKISILMYAIYIGTRKSGEGVLAIKLLPERIRLFSILLLLYILIMILADLVGYTFGIDLFFRYSAWSHTFAAIIVYLYSKSNPLSMLEITGAIQKARYSKSKLTGVNSKEAQIKLSELVFQESYYADEDLRLSTLSDAMEMTPHQLSELINVHYKMTFIQYINSHRVIFAMKLLEENSRNILSIAFAVGFNSKSAFNRVFRQFIGNSPREYRKDPKRFLLKKTDLLKKIEPKL